MKVFLNNKYENYMVEPNANVPKGKAIVDDELKNHLCADGSVDIPEVLRPYMGGKEKILPRS